MKFIIFSILLHFITACKYWQSASLSVLVVGDMSMLTFFNCIFYFCFVFVHCMCSRMRALIICTWCVIMLLINYQFLPRFLGVSIINDLHEVTRTPSKLGQNFFTLILYIGVVYVYVYVYVQFILCSCSCKTEKYPVQ